MSKQSKRIEQKEYYTITTKAWLNPVTYTFNPKTEIRSYLHTRYPRETVIFSKSTREEKEMQKNNRKSKIIHLICRRTEKLGEYIYRGIKTERR